MNKFYQKSELWFSIFWIIVYIIGTSITDDLSSRVGIEKSVTAGFYLFLCTVLLIWIFTNKFHKKFGLCKPTLKAKQLLYFIPLIVLLSVNFWVGIEIELNLAESITFIITMLCVGFIEEIIFRGFLFKALEKDGIKSAIIISSVSFGAGHIINLFLNSANLISNICQICYAISTGFLFVILFYKGKSLLPCIITHSLFNALSLFTNESIITTRIEILLMLAMVAITTCYSIYLIRKLPQNNIEENNDTNQENTTQN